MTLDPRLLTILVVVLGQMACATTDCRRASSSDDEIELVSIIQLIANPENYHLRYVGVMGIVDLDANGGAVYLHYEDFEESTLGNAVGIEADPTKYPDVDGLYASVHGCFLADDHGHLGSFVGSIANVERLVTFREAPERRITNP
jgi:hypothetical protein